MRDMDTVLGKSVLRCLFILFAGISTIGQDQGRMMIQATAMGTSTQMGKVASINILIEQFSTQDDRQALMDAFARSGQHGLVDTLKKMTPKGRVRFASGGVGNDLKYVMELPSENGRRLRLITDRNMSIGELRSTSRSKYYDVGTIELTLTPDGKGGSGTLLPACKVTVDKKTQQIKVETLQNPWNLSNLRISNN